MVPATIECKEQVKENLVDTINVINVLCVLSLFYFYIYNIYIYMLLFFKYFIVLYSRSYAQGTTGSVSRVRLAGGCAAAAASRRCWISSRIWCRLSSVPGATSASGALA